MPNKRKTSRRPSRKARSVEADVSDPFTALLQDLDGLSQLQTFQMQLLSEVRRELESLRQQSQTNSKKPLSGDN